MSDDAIDITPDTHFLQSIRADRGQYWALLAEGVDNAFDADARDVELTLTRSQVALSDNGVGISRDRQTAIVKLGEHRAMPTTMLGMFGIGLKYLAVSAGDVLEVDSCSVDGRMKLRADWQEVIRSGRWSIPKPKWITSVHQQKTGTTIQVSALRWPPPIQKDVQAASDKLRQLFYPAMTEGRRIVLNGQELVLLREPTMHDIVEGDIRLSNGKGAHVRGGLIDDPKSSALYQVQVSYRHRVIMPQSIFGCGSYTGLRRMFARVVLTGPWTLDRFKKDLADNDAEELDAAVLEILRPVLVQCHSAQMSMRVREMAALLNEMLPEALRPARPPDTKERKQRKGRKAGRSGQTDGPETPRGPASKRLPGEKIIIAFEEVNDEWGYGKFEPGRPSRIVLAIDNPTISKLLEFRDQAIGAESLYGFAAMVYHHERPLLPGQTELEFGGPFGLRSWQMSKSQSKSDDVAESA